MMRAFLTISTTTTLLLLLCNNTISAFSTFNNKSNNIAFQQQPAAATCEQFQQNLTFNFRGHEIYYDKLELNGNHNRSSSSNSKKDVVLLLNGFGVGAFHNHRLIDSLVGEIEAIQGGGVDNNNNNNNRAVVVYTQDYLGQGRSWPSDCDDDGSSESERGLQYSIDLWVDQVECFLDTVIIIDKQPQPHNIHLVGNSVGGHLATILAARRPDLIDSLVLLNATPIWGLNLPGWSGVLPPPVVPREIGRFAFDRIRDLDTISIYLKQAYSKQEAFDEILMNQIRGATLGKGGHAAFASIMWSAPSQTFDDEKTKTFTSLIKSKVKCDVLLVFGSDDEWCKPAYAKYILSELHEARRNDLDDNAYNKSATQRYVALSNTGHCPNHEAPRAVAHLLGNWLRNGPSGELISPGFENIKEDWADIDLEEVGLEDAKKLTLSDQFLIKFLA